MKFLLEQRGIHVNPPNFKDRTPYLLAAREGNYEVIKEFIGYNDKLYEEIDKINDIQSDNPKGVLLTVADENDQTALHLIARRVNNRDSETEIQDYRECEN